MRYNVLLRRLKIYYFRFLGLPLFVRAGILISPLIIFGIMVGVFITGSLILEGLEKRQNGNAVQSSNSQSPIEPLQNANSILQNQNSATENTSLKTSFKKELSSPTALYNKIDSYSPQFQEIQAKKYDDWVEWIVRIESHDPDEKNLDTVNLVLRDIYSFQMEDDSATEEDNSASENENDSANRNENGSINKNIPKRRYVNIWPKIKCTASLSKHEWLAKRIEGKFVKVRGFISDINGIDKENGISSLDKDAYVITLVGGQDDDKNVELEIVSPPQKPKKRRHSK